MKKILKYTAIFFSAIVLMAILAIVIFIHFFNPNHFKPLIANQIKKYVGREVVIEGDISWAFFPNFGIKIDHLNIDNIKIATTTVEAKLLPILHGILDVSGIDLMGVNNDVIKNAEIHAKNIIFIDSQTLAINTLSGNIANVPITGTLNVNNLFNISHIIVQGNFVVDTLQINHVRLSQLNIHSHFQDKVLELSPVTALLYQGDLRSQVKMDFNTAQPQLTINTTLNNIQIEPLLSDVGGQDLKISMQGMGNIDFQVTSEGSDSDTILHHLNGSGRFNMDNGTLIGIDLNEMINNAYALANKQSVLPDHSNQTHFERLTGMMTIHNGILQSDDLLMESPNFEVKGSGRIDFPSRWINYMFLTTIKKHSTDQTDNWANLFGIAVPVAVRGNLNDPAVSIDAGQLFKALAEHQAKEQIKKNIQGSAGDLLQQIINH